MLANRKVFSFFHVSTFRIFSSVLYFPVTISLFLNSFPSLSSMSVVIPNTIIFSSSFASLHSFKNWIINFIFPFIDSFFNPDNLTSCSARIARSAASMSILANHSIKSFSAFLYSFLLVIGTFTVCLIIGGNSFTTSRNSFRK